MISLIASWLQSSSVRNIAFMTSLFWIKARKARQLAIMAAPAAETLEQEIADWKAQGLDMVVSVLEDSEIKELGLANEANLCKANGIEFVRFPIEDCNVPASKDAADVLAQHLSTLVGENKRIGIHCRAGIGRSTLLAACVLMHMGYGPKKSLKKITKARGLPVPETYRQLDWIMAFRHGDELTPTLKV